MRTREGKIVERCIQAVEEQVCPGGIVGIVAATGERELFPFGHYTYELSSPLVVESTIYDVASITKSIPTASLALALIDKGALKLGEKVLAYIREYKDDRVTIKHLLTYTIDSAPLSVMKDRSAQHILGHIFSRTLEYEPGTSFRYANTPALLLGLVVERLLGVDLALAAADYLFKPLKMKRTGFVPSTNMRRYIAPSEGGLVGVAHDESARVFAKEGRAVGHAGLFSSAPDLLNFLEMLLNGGEMSGRRYFSNHIVREMATNQIADLGESTGLGWELNQAHFMGKYRSVHTFGKTGFTGCNIVCDIERDVAFAILTNRTYPRRPPGAAKIAAFRNDIADFILSS